MKLNLNHIVRSLGFKERIDIVKSSNLSSSVRDLPVTINENLDIENLILQSYQLEHCNLNAVYDNDIITNVLGDITSDVSANNSVEFGKTLSKIKSKSADEKISKLFIVKIASDLISEKTSEIKLMATNKPLFNPDLVEGLFLKYLIKDLSEIAYRTLIYEFNLAIQNDFLKCSNIDDIQNVYEELINDNDYIEYLKDKYPYLIKKVINRLLIFTASFSKLINRLSNDIRELENHFCCKGLKVTNITRGQGDSHHGADSVSIIEFDNDRKIVYKPRSVTSEDSFQKFIEWANSHLEGIKPKIFDVIPKDGYGWVEFIPHKDVDSSDQIKSYYYRYGLLLAAMDCVNATDIHFENLIASGEHPVVIDLENIFQPIEIRREDDDVPLYLMDLEFFTASTFFTAMIDPIFINRSLNGSPLTNPIASNSETMTFIINDSDQFEIIPENTVSNDSHCLFHENKPVCSYEYSKEILKGYSVFGEMVIKNKNKLVSKVFPSTFKETDIRVIFKSTRKYFRFVESLHAPFSLENSLNHDKYIHKLWMPVITKPALAKVFDSEAESCSMGDIPYFHTKANSIDVYDHTNKKIKGILHKSGYERTIEKILFFNNSTLKNNLACINYSLTHKGIEKGSRQSDDDKSLNAGADYKKLFKLINGRIVFEGSKLIFVDLYLNKDFQTRHSELNNYIYSGLAGLSLSLAYYGRFEKCIESEKNARRIANKIFREIDFNNIDRLGACQGLGGIIYLASHLGWLWNDNFYFILAESFVDKALTLSYTDRHFDIYSGLSGLILSIVSLYNATKNEKLLPKIESATEILISMSETDSQKRWWLSSIPSNGPTTGFAHGLSGIGYSILKAYVSTNNEKYLKVSKEIHNYMVSCFDKHSKTWMESNSANTHGQLEVWCHGSPGISLFYAELIKNDDSKEVKDAYQIAIENTKKNNIFENDSLCHGSLGNIDVFINMRNPSNESSTAVSEEIINETVKDIEGRDVRCGNKFKHHNFSLFTGFSGLAFQLMRTQSKNYIPSVLTFEGPDCGCK